MRELYVDLSPQGKRTARRLAVSFLVLLNVFVLTLAASYGFSAWGGAREALGISKPLEVSVAGEGKVTARPDVARISASVLTEAGSLAPAQDENSQKSNAVVAYLKAQGVTETDIKTVGYNIYPQYRYPEPCRGDACPLDAQRPRIIGYQIRHAYEITVRDLGKAGAILAGVVSAGANEVGGIAFTIDKPDAPKAEARAKAIADARAKALGLAADLDRRLGPMTGFAEGGGVPPPIIYSREALGKGGGGEPAIQPGENEIAVTVSITYEFR